MQMMWAADFDESLAYDLEVNCLEALDIHLPRDSSNDLREEVADSDDGSVKSGSQSNHNENDNTKASQQSNHENTDVSVWDAKLKSLSSYPFCGLARNMWPRNGRVQMSTMSSLTRKEKDELAIFCVAAILVLNRQKVIRETHSFDDMIKASALIFCFYRVINYYYESHNCYTPITLFLLFMFILSGVEYLLGLDYVLIWKSEVGTW